MKKETYNLEEIVVLIQQLAPDYLSQMKKFIVRDFDGENDSFEYSLVNVIDMKNEIEPIIRHSIDYYKMLNNVRFLSLNKIHPIIEETAIDFGFNLIFEIESDVDKTIEELFDEGKTCKQILAILKERGINNE